MTAPTGHGHGHDNGDGDAARDAEDPLTQVDPWVALHDGRAQLLRALDALGPGDDARLLGDASGWTAADVLSHLAAWDELTTRFLRAVANGARALAVEAAPDNDWAEWNADRVADAAGIPLRERIARLHAARADLIEVASALDPALFDEPFATPWGTRDTVRAYLVGQAMHDGMHADAIARTDRGGTHDAPGGGAG